MFAPFDQMLRVMAEENNEYYKTNVAVVNETVLAVWRHLCKLGLPIIPDNCNPIWPF